MRVGGTVRPSAVEYPRLLTPFIALPLEKLGQIAFEISHKLNEKQPSSLAALSISTPRQVGH